MRGVRARSTASCFGLLSIALGALCWMPAAAQIPGPGLDSYHAPPDPRWGPITATDVEAAYALLRDNHPGAAPALHDTDFQGRLRSAHAAAKARAAQVSSYQGYVATLAAFAVAMGDKHIWSRPTFGVEMPRWPGFILSKRGNLWEVTDASGKQASLEGAHLVGCDGKTVDELARKSLGTFRVDWRVGAQQLQSAPWLLVDEGNPFIERPVKCDFERNGSRATVALKWERIKRDTLAAKLKKAGGAGAAGFGVRRVGNGYWIALQDLASDDATQVVQAVAAQKSELRKAPFVVLDMRGNGGGSSLMGRDIAVSLYGAEFVDSRLGPAQGGGCDAPWRASPGNVRELEYLLDSGVLPGGGAMHERLQAELTQARSALARKDQFSIPLVCHKAESGSKQTPAAKSLLKGKMLVVTDNRCFSSCLLVTEHFRDLGATQFGQTTDAATRFLEVREEYLPSGYSMFSTLQAVSLDDEAQIGPFEPKIAYDGDIADTQALEAWVVNTAVAAAGQ